MSQIYPDSWKWVYRECCTWSFLCRSCWLVTDPLGKIFTHMICTSRNAGFTWCFRGNELTVYPASRVNTGAGEAKLQKYTWIFSVSLAAQPCVLFELPAYIWLLCCNKELIWFFSVQCKWRAWLGAVILAMLPGSSCEIVVRGFSCGSEKSYEYCW